MGNAILKEEDEPDGLALPSSPEVVRAGFRLATKGMNVVPLSGTWDKTRKDFDSETEYQIYQHFKSVDLGLIIDYVEAQPKQSIESGAVMDESIPYQQWLAHACPKGYTNLIKTRPRHRWTNDDIKIVHGERCDAPVRGHRRRVRLDGKWQYQWVPEHLIIHDTVVEDATLLYDSTGLSQSPTARTVRRMPRTYDCVNGLRSNYDCEFIWIGKFTPENVEIAHQRYDDRRAYSQAVREKHGKQGYTPPNVGRSLVRTRPPGYDIKGVHTRGGHDTVGTGTVEWFCRNPSGVSALHEGEEEAWPHGIVHPNAAGLNAAMHQRGEVVWNRVRQEMFDLLWPDHGTGDAQALAEYAETLKAKPTGKFEAITDDTRFEWVLPWSDEVVGLAECPEDSPLEGEYIPAGVVHDEVNHTELLNLRGRSYEDRNLSTLVKTFIERQFDTNMVALERDHGSTTVTFQLHGGFWKLDLDLAESVPILAALIKDNTTDHEMMMSHYIQARVRNGGLAQVDSKVNVEGLLMDIKEEVQDLEDQKPPVMVRGDLYHWVNKPRPGRTYKGGYRRYSPRPDTSNYKVFNHHAYLYGRRAFKKKGGVLPPTRMALHIARVDRWELTWRWKQWAKLSKDRPDDYLAMYGVIPKASRPHWRAQVKRVVKSFKSWLVGESVPVPKPAVQVPAAIKRWGRVRRNVLRAVPYQIPERVKVEGGDYDTPIRDLLRRSTLKYRGIGAAMYDVDSNGHAQPIVPDLPVEETEKLHEVIDLVGPGSYRSLEFREMQRTQRGAAKRIKHRRSKRLDEAA